MQFYEIAKIGPGIIVEDKDYSIALHYRLAPHLGGQVMDAVAAIYDRAGSNAFEILPGKSVVEIKPRGFNKGARTEIPDAARALCRTAAGFHR